MGRLSTRIALFGFGFRTVQCIRRNGRRSGLTGIFNLVYWEESVTQGPQTVKVYSTTAVIPGPTVNSSLAQSRFFQCCIDICLFVSPPRNLLPEFRHATAVDPVPWIHHKVAGIGVGPYQVLHQFDRLFRGVCFDFGGLTLSAWWDISFRLKCTCSSYLYWRCFFTVSNLRAVHCRLPVCHDYWFYFSEGLLFCI